MTLRNTAGGYLDYLNLLWKEHRIYGEKNHHLYRKHHYVSYILMFLTTACGYKIGYGNIEDIYGSGLEYFLINSHLTCLVHTYLVSSRDASII